jgi:cyclophilin family peptidyl-prolyl cis-trans isomerase/protein-disulfide isomerase
MKIRLKGFSLAMAICPLLSGTIAPISFQVVTTMRKYPMFILILLAAVLTGCLSAKETAQPTQSPVPTVVLDIPAASDDFSTNSGCTVVAVKPTPGPTPESPFMPVTEDEWTRGPVDAPITIIEYSDFQCPYCAQLAPSIERLIAEFPTELRVVFRHFPLIGTPEQPFHENSALATQAAEAAGKQGLFWKMHDMLFSRQSEWTELSGVDFQDWLVVRAGELELDVEQFTADLTGQELVDFAQEAWDKGGQLGLSSTPTLIFNGNAWPSNVPMDYWSLWAVIKLTLLEDRQYYECPQMAIDPTAQYVATLETEKGNIVLELYPDVAPLTVNSFIFLAQNGWFDGVTFHRVLPGFVAQAGDPSGTGYGGPGYAFRNEISADYTFDGPGVVAMANAGADSNGSQFFITYAAAPQLDGSYTIFGHVIAGMDVLESLTSRDPAANADLPPGDLILRVTIEQR